MTSTDSAPRAPRLETLSLPAWLARRAAADGLAQPLPVVVVGSGYGGSMAVHALAAAAAARAAGGPKLEVLVLERGQHWEPGRFPASLGQAPGAVRVAPQGGGTVSNAEGLFDIRTGPDVSALVASGVGGGSLINAGVMMEPDPDQIRCGTLAARWQSLQGRQMPARVRRLLGAEVWRQGQWIANTADRYAGRWPKLDVLHQLGRDLKHRARAVPVTISLDGQQNAAGAPLQACTGCGDCLSGCNVGAKDSLDRNLLLQAQSQPGVTVTVVTGATVQALRRENDAWVLEVQHTQARLALREAEALPVRAERVILAAGSLGSSEILLRSRSGRLRFSARLGESFSANGDNLAALHRTEAPVNGIADPAQHRDARGVGPTITGSLPLHPPEARVVQVQDFAVPAVLAPVVAELITTAACLDEVARRDPAPHRPADPDPVAVDPKALAHTLVVGLIGHDDASGVLRLAEPPSQRLRQPAVGTLRIDWPGARDGAELLAAQQALDGLASRLPGLKPRKAPQSLRNPLWQPAPTALEPLGLLGRGPVVTVHPLGGCRMGDDAASGVVDVLGRVFDAGATGTQPSEWFGSLLVLDGAIVGASLGANPALTIASLALGAVEDLLVSDAHWQALAPAPAPQARPDPQPQPDARSAPAAANAPANALPLPQPGPRAPQPAPTVLEIVERMVSQPVRVGDHLVVIVMTLALVPTDAATLVAPDRKPVRFDPRRSSLRLYDAGAWAEGALAHRDDDDRASALLLEAPLGGSLRFLHAEASAAWRRFVRAGLSWLQRREPARLSRGRCADRRAGAVSGGDPRKLLCMLCSHGSRAGQVRRFDYTFKVQSPLVVAPRATDLVALLEGQSFAGCKRLSFRRRENPWEQLTRMTLDRGLAPGSAAPVLTLDLRYLAERAQPLVRIVSQPDGVQGLAALAGLGLYIARAVLSVHLLSFSAPQRARPRTPQRLPQALPGLGEPQLTWLAVDRWPRGSARADEPVRVRLARWPQPAGREPGTPLVMIHGYSASGTTFAHPSLRPSAAQWFHARGYDVWVLDLRSSCGMDGATHPWSMETIALVDIPAALLHVQAVTGRRCDVLAHCIGGAMLGMAMLADAEAIRTGQQQLGADTWLTGDHLERLAAFTRGAPGAPHAVVRSVILSQKGPVMRYTGRNVLQAFIMQFARRLLLPAGLGFQRSAAPGLGEQLLDRFLSTLPYDEADLNRERPWALWGDTAWTATRHRLDAVFGQVFKAGDLNDETLACIDDFFGPLSWDTVAQTIHFAAWDRITNQRGNPEFVTPQRLRERWGGVPTLALHSADNGLADPDTLNLLQRHLGGAGVPVKRHLFTGMGHQDALIGRRAPEVFEVVDTFLSELDKAPAQEQEPEQPTTRSSAEPAWIGPRLLRPTPGATACTVVAIGRPDLGPARLWMVPVQRQAGPNGTPAWTVLPPAPARPWPCSAKGGGMAWLQVDVAVWPDAAQDPAFGWLALTAHDTDASSAAGASRDRPVALKLMDGQLKEPLAIDWTGAPELDLSASPAPEREALWQAEVQRFLATPAGARDADAVFLRACDVSRALRLHDDANLRFALGSCQYPYGLFDREPASASLAALAAAGASTVPDESVALALMVGDQIYADATAGLLDPTRRDELYEQPHLRALRLGAMRDVMRRMPVETLPDDHEFFDNWEPLPAAPGTTGVREPEPLRRHRRELDRARQHGAAAFHRFQRAGQGAPTAPFDLTFMAGGHRFFLLDTRTGRSRGRPGDNTAAHIVDSPARRAAFEEWLTDKESENLVKFVVSPSLFLPRRRITALAPADACRSDAWDGYPASMAWMLELIARRSPKHLVFLSGDEHHSMVAECWVGPSRVKVLSVHASAFHAPLPFANGSPEDLLMVEDDQAQGVRLEVKATAAPPGDGWAALRVQREAQGLVLEVCFHRPGAVGPATPWRLALT